MKNFLKLIETARMHGVTLEWDRETDYEEKLTGEYLKSFWKTIEQCQPFVFYEESEEIDFQDQKHNTDTQTIENAPFQIFSLESSKGPLLKQTSNTIEFFNEKYNNKNDGGLYFDCILCIETGPLEWSFYALIHGDLGTVFRVTKFIGLSSLITSYLEKLPRSEIGTESIRERVKIGSGNEKRTHTVRKIILICPKKSSQSVREALGSRQVDWSHRWKVRGHWVKLSEGKLGKNREGDYCVVGFTWRREHEKGPEDAPLINKTRVVG